MTARRWSWTWWRLTLLVLLCIVLFAPCSSRMSPPASRLRTYSREIVADGSETCPSHNKTAREVLRKARRKAFTGGLYGATAGGVQVLSLMWLRTIVNHQYRYGGSFASVVQHLYAEGGVKRFYRGAPFALAQNLLAKFGSVAAHEGSRVLSLHWRGAPSPLLQSILTVLLATLWRTLLMPLETVKTVLQVDGPAGFRRLLACLSAGKVSVLYAGATAVVLSTLTSHYPWYLVHNLLEHTWRLPATASRAMATCHAVCIGLCATTVADIMSNALRVIKTVMQAEAARGMSYGEAVQQVVQEGGWLALCGRGLGVRLVANALQGVLFTLLWKLLPVAMERRRERARRTT